MVSILSAASICSVYLLLHVLCWVVFLCSLHSISPLLYPAFVLNMIFLLGCLLSLLFQMYQLAVPLFLSWNFFSWLYSQVIPTCSASQSCKGTYESSWILMEIRKMLFRSPEYLLVFGIMGYSCNMFSHSFMSKLRQTAGWNTEHFTVWGTSMQCKSSSCWHC